MANLLRQRLGALLARPPSLQTSRNAVTKRFYASKAHEHDDADETHKWRSVTIAAYILCITLGVYTFANEEHNHENGSPAYSYLHIRNKEFPWGEDGLFEYKHHESHEEN